MKLTKEDALKAANLANLILDDDALERAKLDLSEFLVFSEQLDSVDTDSVLPAVCAVSFENVLRDDEACVSLTREDVLKNSKMKNEDGFIVPKVVE